MTADSMYSSLRCLAAIILSVFTQNFFCACRESVQENGK